MVQGRLTLDVSRCATCPNGFVEGSLKARSAAIAVAGLMARHQEPRFLVPGEMVQRQQENLDRRGFFKSLRKTLVSGAKSAMASIDEKGYADTSYGEKRIPGRRSMLNGMREGIDADLAEKISLYFDARASFSANCSGCCSCAAACPTGALSRAPGKTSRSEEVAVPLFEPGACVSCGLCEEFCSDGAIAIIPLSGAKDIEGAQAERIGALSETGSVHE
jgi:ferredoxin